MSGTQEWRPCYICGEKVLWQTNGIGWHPIQYHDCKPVPGARLEQAERERDEARREADAMRARPAMVADGQILARLGEATALLLEARKHAPTGVRTFDINYENNTITEVIDVPLADRIDSFIDGQPAPVAPMACPPMSDEDKAKLRQAVVGVPGHVQVVPAIDDAMVERACRVKYGAEWWDSHIPQFEESIRAHRDEMRAVLVAALEGRT